MIASDQNHFPSGWVMSDLKVIVQLNPPLGKVLPDSAPVNFVPMAAVESEGGGLARPEVRSYGAVKKGYTAFQSGEVIMAKITPCMENGKITVVPDLPDSVCFGSTEFHVFRPEDGIEARWVKYYLLQSWFRRHARMHMTGSAGQLRVPSSFLEAVKIPIAPTTEQRRIVEAVDELLSDLDAGVAALQRVQTKLKQYRASVLKAAVEGRLTETWRNQHPEVEPASELLKRILDERRRRWEEEQLRRFSEKGKEPPENWRAKYPEPSTPHAIDLLALPDKWCWVTVDQCSSLVQYGTSAKMGADSSGIPVLRMGNVLQDGRLDFSDLKYLPADHSEFPELLLEAGDLLFNRTNSAELVGKTGIYQGTPSSCSFASYLIRVRLLPRVLPTIVMNALNSDYGRRWIKGVVNQTVGQANVNGSKLSAFTFPLAPKAEQEAIVEATESHLSVIEHLEADVEVKLNAAQTLRQAILRHAFTGRLAPQDPNDEPASELIERIAAERRQREEATEKSKGVQIRVRRTGRRTAVLTKER